VSTLSGEFSRPSKVNNAQTVLYEIDMLRFAKNRLEAASTPGDEWVYLEGFLLHYRNLIEFFGKQQIGDGDLSILQPDLIWPGQVPKKASLDLMTRPDLWEKYDTRDNDQAISKYLHHCTEQRMEPRPPWHVNAMFEELRPIIETFESLLPEYKPATGFLTCARVVSSLDSYSTTSIRTTGLSLFPDK
jgi:hypothetical protein